MPYAVRPDVLGISPLAASQIPVLKSAGPDRSKPVTHVIVHTTGSGVVEKARKEGVTPFHWACRYYAKPESYSPAYVVAYNGEICAIADEHERAPHTGVEEDRADLSSEGWRAKVSPVTRKLWDTQWKGRGFKCPLDLVSQPNNMSVGIECIPLVLPDPEGFLPMRAGLKFTAAQHESVRGLVYDIGRRWGFPMLQDLGGSLRKWRNDGRLLEHSDVNPISRSDKGGGWDIGGLREAPYWDWGFVTR